jgi:hypothetical protein
MVYINYAKCVAFPFFLSPFYILFIRSLSSASKSQEATSL